MEPREYCFVFLFPFFIIFLFLLFWLGWKQMSSGNRFKRTKHRLSLDSTKNRSSIVFEFVDFLGSCHVNHVWVVDFSIISLHRSFFKNYEFKIYLNSPFFIFLVRLMYLFFILLIFFISKLNWKNIIINTRLLSSLFFISVKNWFLI